MGCISDVMNSGWFTEEGVTGNLGIEMRDDGWFVTSPGEVGETRCLIDYQIELDDSEEKQEISVKVDKFRKGHGNNVNFLSVSANRNQNLGKGVSESKARKKNIQVENKSKQSTQDWDLRDFNGTGEYVNVEATVDAVFYVKKNVPRMPDMKGELTDDSVLNPVAFIVEDGVKHPYLGEGKRFYFEGVKDHYYKKEAEVQVVINRNTRFTELN